MGVQISDIPKIGFSQNEILVSLDSDNYVKTEGVAAEYDLYWDEPPAEGDVLYVHVNKLFSIELFVSDTPDDSGNQLPSQGTYTDTEYVLILIEALKKNFYLSQYYTIEVSDVVFVKIKARNTGVAYTILSGGMNLTLNQVVAPVDHQIQSNFYHYLEIWTENEKLYESLLPLNYPINGKTTIDISSILHASLSLDIPKLTELWQKCEKSVLSYRLRYTNAFGEPINVNEMTNTENRFVTLGGFSRMALAHISDPEHLKKYLMADPSLYQSQKWFEAYPVEEIEVKTNQPQFLYFINAHQSETLRIKVEAIHEDASTSQLILAGGELAAYGKVCIAVGYVQLGLDALSTEENKIVSYTVQLIGTDDQPRTVAKTFRINRCYEANTRYFLFAGSDGNFKTLRTYGSADPSAEFTRESGVQENQQAAKIQFGDVVTFDVVSYENEVVSTGYILSRRSHESIKEFMLTTRAFRVIGDKLIPIEILSDRMPLPLELRKTGYVQIEYRLAWDEKLYTGDTSALNVPSIAQSQEALNDI